MRFAEDKTFAGLGPHELVSFWSLRGNETNKQKTTTTTTKKKHHHQQNNFCICLQSLKEMNKEKLLGALTFPI